MVMVMVSARDKVSAGDEVSAGDDVKNLQVPQDSPAFDIVQSQEVL